MRKGILFLVLLTSSLPLIGNAQEHHAQYVQGEVIVKFKTISGTARRSIAADGLSTELRNIGVKDAKQLMPLTGSKMVKNRRASSSNESETAYRNISKLYLLHFDKSKSVENVIEQLNGRKVVVK